MNTAEDHRRPRGRCAARRTHGLVVALAGHGSERARNQKSSTNQNKGRHPEETNRKRDQNQCFGWQEASMSRNGKGQKSYEEGRAKCRWSSSVSGDRCLGRTPPTWLWHVAASVVVSGDHQSQKKREGMFGCPCLLSREGFCPKWSKLSFLGSSTSYSEIYLSK